MENHELLDNEQHSSGNLLSAASMDALTGLAKWLRYTAIFGLFSVGIGVIVNIITKQYLQIVITLISIIFSLILYYTASHLKLFITNKNPADFAKYASNIKHYFLVIGILIIIGFAVFILAIIAMLAFGIFMAQK